MIMTIATDETLPAATFIEMGENGPEAVVSGDLFDGRKVVLFALPGAYTGVCSTQHVPSFMRTAQAFKDKGVEEIICVSVNDPFVMKAWSDATGAGAAGIRMLSDAGAGFTKALGMDFSIEAAGLIDRSKRYAMFVDNGAVKVLHLEESAGSCDISGGESLLAAI